MTPQEKAKELIEKYLNMNDGLIQEFIPIPIEGAKQCALIAVDEIINSNPHSNPLNTDVHSTMSYWNEIKHEIEKL